MEDKEKLDIIDSQIRECFGRVVWTHKTHEKCADILNANNNNLKLTQIILSAIVTTGIIAQFCSDSIYTQIFTAIISLLLLILNTYLKKYDFGKHAQKHAETAIELWNIRELYLSLITDIRTNALNINQIAQRRDELQNTLCTLYKGAPRSFSKAYAQASAALKVNEEYTFSKEEINEFLPDELKKL